MTKSYLDQAARLAEEGVQRGDGGPFGAVVVDAQGAVVAGACNRVLVARDPTAHAEMEAIRAACAKLGRFSLKGCTIYTTCEPCPMCLAAIHWARLHRVVYSLTRNDAARIGFDDARIYKAMANPSVRMERVDWPAAAEVFSLWQSKRDRTPY